jgi:prevent-host-death family protein
MKVVDIRELKSRLSEYIREVRGGEDLLVSDRGEVAAELVPPRRHALAPAIPPGLAELARKGLATPGLPNDPAFYPDLPTVVPAGTGWRLLDDNRTVRDAQE